MIQCLNKSHPQIKRLLNTIPSEFMLSSILSKYPNDYNILDFELVNSSNDLFNTKLVYESEYNDSLKTKQEDIQSLVNDISNRFNIDIFVDNTLPVSGRYENGRIYINMDKVDTNTLFHELSHPIVQMIKEMNNDNYEELLSELYNNPYGIELLNKSKALYQDQDISIQEEEALVELIANYSSGKILESIEQGSKMINDNLSLFSKLKLMLKEFSKMFMNLFGNKNNKMIKELNNDIGIHKLANIKSISEVVQLVKYGTNIDLRTSYRNKNEFENKILQTKLSKQSIESIIQMFKEGNSIKVQDEQYHKDNIDIIIVDNVTESYKQLSELTGARLVNTNNEVVYIPFNSRIKDSYDSRFSDNKSPDKWLSAVTSNGVFYDRSVIDQKHSNAFYEMYIDPTNPDYAEIKPIMDNEVMRRAEYLGLEPLINAFNVNIKGRLPDVKYLEITPTKLIKQGKGWIVDKKGTISSTLDKSNQNQIANQTQNTNITPKVEELINQPIVESIPSTVIEPIVEQEDLAIDNTLNQNTVPISNYTVIDEEVVVDELEDLTQEEIDNLNKDIKIIEQFTEEPIQQTQSKLFDINKIKDKLKSNRLERLNSISDNRINKSKILNNIDKILGLRIEQAKETKQQVKELLDNNKNEENTNLNNSSNNESVTQEVNTELTNQSDESINPESEITNEEIKEIINEVIEEEIENVLSEDKQIDSEERTATNEQNVASVKNKEINESLTIRNKKNTNFVFMGVSAGFHKKVLLEPSHLKTFNDRLKDIDDRIGNISFSHHNYGNQTLPEKENEESFIIEKHIIKGKPVVIFSIYKMAFEVEKTRTGTYYGASIVSQDGLELNYGNCIKVLRLMMQEIENQVLTNSHPRRFRFENGVKEIKYNQDFLSNIKNSLDLEIFRDTQIQVPSQSLYKAYNTVEDFVQDNSSSTKVLKINNTQQNERVTIPPQIIDSRNVVENLSSNPEQTTQIDSQSIVDNSAIIEDTLIEQQATSEEIVSDSENSAGTTNSLSIKIEEYIEEKVKEELETRREEIEKDTLDTQIVSQLDEKEKIVYEELDKEAKNEIKQTFKTKGLTLIKKLTKYITNFITGGFLFKSDVEKKIKQDIKSVKLQSIIKSILNKLKRTGKYILFLITTYGVVFSTNIYNDVNTYPISFSNLINNTSKNAQFVIELLPEVYQQQALRGLNKIGLYDVDEEIVTVLPSYTKNTSELKNNSTSTDYSFYKEYQKVKDNFKGSGQTDSLYVYERQTTNEEGFIYIPSPTIKNSKPEEKISKVSGVGHFLITYENTDLTNNTSDSKLKVEKDRIIEQYKNQNPNGWIPVFKKLNRGVTLSFKKLNEINEEDIVMTRLYQRNFGDLDFDEYKKSNKLVGGKKSIMDTNKNQSVDQLQFTKKDAYGRLSGGSAIFIFNVNGQTIIREAAGSVNFLEQVGKNIANQYNLDKKDITMGFFDAGSYAAKPASYKGNVIIDQYRGYGSSTSTGAGLMIPTLELQQELSTIESKLINNNQIKPTCRL